MLLQDEDYVETYNKIQGMVQSEILNYFHISIINDLFTTLYICKTLLTFALFLITLRSRRIWKKS